MSLRNLAIIYKTIEAHIITWGVWKNHVLPFLTLIRAYAGSDFFKRSGLPERIISLSDFEFKKEIDLYLIEKALYCWGLLEIRTNL